MKACGLPVIRLHDARHGVCSLLLALTVHAVTTGESVSGLAVRTL